MVPHLRKVNNSHYFSIHFSRCPHRQYCDRRWSTAWTDVSPCLWWEMVSPPSEAQAQEQMRGEHDARDVTGPQSLPKKLWKWICFSYLSQFGPIIHLIVKPNVNRPEIVIIFIHTTSWILLILPKEWPRVWLKGLPQILCKCFITSSICPILPVHNVKNCEFWNTYGLKGFERTVDM